MRKYVRFLPWYALAVLISAVGLAWQLCAPNRTALIILLILALLPIPLMIASAFFAKRYVKKIRDAKVADMREYVLRHRQEAEQTAQVLLKKLQRRRRATAVCTVLITLLGVCAAICGGMLCTAAPFLLFLFVFYAGTVFLAVYSRIEKKKPLELADDAPVLKREDFPLLHDTAYRAARALGCHKEIVILLTHDCNAGIVFDKKRYYLRLGAILLSILTQEELYCICLHEFSHCSEKTMVATRETDYAAWISTPKEIPLPAFLVTHAFTFLDVLYLFDSMTYEYATSVIKETEADRDMGRHGNPTAAASALLKLDYDNKFSWESDALDRDPIYAAEKPNPHYLRELAEEFKQAIRTRQKDWNAMIEKEILPNNASHPTLRMRWETLGVDHVDEIEYPSDSPYADEMQQILDLADTRLVGLQDTYEKDRRESYLDPLDRINDWKKNGEPISAETYADVISDLRKIGRDKEAELLCERVIEELDENSSYHAYFIKGCMMLHRYDERGVDLIYHALEGNHNYLEEGLDLLGIFFCMTGREQELLDYRARVAQLAQQDKDEFSQTCFLSKTDKLTRDEMPREMLDEILSYIHSVDEDIIQDIYLVRKTISETYFSSAFIIHFYGGTDAQQGDIMYKIFRYLDTYPVEWHFSLFDYFECPEIKFDKIEGSLVYTKNNKGEKK